MGEGWINNLKFIKNKNKASIKEYLSNFSCICMKIFLFLKSFHKPVDSYSNIFVTVFYIEEVSSMKSSEPKKLINHPDIELYRPRRITWVGFLVAWVIVFVIVAGTVILARIGSWTISSVVRQFSSEIRIGNYPDTGHIRKTVYSETRIFLTEEFPSACPGIVHWKSCLRFSIFVIVFSCNLF